MQAVFSTISQFPALSGVSRETYLGFVKAKVPPVVIVLLVGAAMYGIALAGWPGAFDFPGRYPAGALLFLLGLLFPALGVHRFRLADTTVDPLHPDRTSALVVRGIYSRTRNPMYLGFACMLLAWALFLGSFWAFLGIPLYILWMNRFQIEPEEEALEHRFGEAYREYLSRVRRWL